MTVRKTVGSLPGIGSVDANPDTKNVVVKYDPGVTKLSTIESKLADAGFPVAK